MIQDRHDKASPHLDTQPSTPPRGDAGGKEKLVIEIQSDDSVSASSDDSNRDSASHGRSISSDLGSCFKDSRESSQLISNFGKLGFR
jgi:hypothetical protein